jgi:hypothetical protein
MAGTTRAGDAVFAATPEVYPKAEGDVVVQRPAEHYRHLLGISCGGQRPQMNGQPPKLVKAVARPAAGRAARRIAAAVAEPSPSRYESTFGRPLLRRACSLMGGYRR